MLRFSSCAPLACALLLAACGTALSLSPKELQDGAQQGWVVGFYTADTPPEALPECLAGVGPEAFAEHRFARVQYHRGRGTMTVVAELKKPLTAEVGDDVALWLQPCSRATRSVIFKVAPRSAGAQ